MGHKAPPKLHVFVFLMSLLSFLLDLLVWEFFFSPFLSKKSGGSTKNPFFLGGVLAAARGNSKEDQG